VMRMQQLKEISSLVVSKDFNSIKKALKLKDKNK
jgi:hypothetical protein